MELNFLGTGAGSPSKKRNVSSLILNLLDENAALWMFDCGEGTQHQILHAPLRLSRLSKLFVTHLHGDHIFGIPGILTSRSHQRSETPVTIYGPPGIKGYVENSLSVSDAHLNFDLQLREFDHEGILYEDERFKVSALPLRHRIESFGYRIEEKEQPGSLMTEKLKQLGIAPGPVYGRIKMGENIQLDNGIVMAAEDFLGERKPGRIVTILGDTRPCENAVVLSRSADVVVHESTFANDEHKRAVKYFHSTAAEAAQTAKQAEAKKLILTHLSSRYQDEGESKLLEEARQWFPNTFIAHDFNRFPVGEEKDPY